MDKENFSWYGKPILKCSERGCARPANRRTGKCYKCVRSG